MFNGVEVVVVQIVGLVVCCIVCDVYVGDKLVIGDIYGLIWFGFWLDIYLLVGVELIVNVGQCVVVGEIVLVEC